MRTTLSLDDDVATRLRQLAARRRMGWKETVNTILRRGLAAQEPKRGRRETYRVDSFRSAFRSGVDPLKLNQLLDDLEARERQP